MAEKGDTLYFTIVRNGHKLKFPVVIKLNIFLYLHCVNIRNTLRKM